MTMPEAPVRRQRQTNPRRRNVANGAAPPVQTRCDTCGKFPAHRSKNERTPRCGPCRLEAGNPVR